MGSAMLMLPQPPSSVHGPTALTASGESYRPLLELGRGGMAKVYLAERTTRGLRKLVVLKVLDPSLASDQEMRTAFRREAELCARLNHPNIVQVFEVLDDIAAPMMVMEYVEGVSLSQILSRTDGRLPLRLHVHIVMQVLAGLQYFHELKDNVGKPQLAVHRDVSPQNIVVMHEGAVKVLDFGIAKVRDVASADATQAGIIKGKLSYMPAEQVAGDTSIDRRADLFAVGVLLWEAFARRRMWQSWQQADVVRALVANQIPAIRDACPWISPGWEAIIARATAGRRDDRFDTALDMQIAMEECMSEVGGPVPQRELASFMMTEFGQWREDRQRLVDTELQKPAVPLTTVLGGTVSQSIQLTQASQTPSALSSDDLPSGRSVGARRRWPIGTAVAGLLVVAVGATVTAAFPGTGARSHPSTAKNTPLASSLAPTAESARQRSANLEPPTLATSAAPAPSTPTKAAERSKSRGLAARATRVVTPAPVASAASAPAPVINCNPPYVLDSEGVKTYRPECF